MTKNAETRVAGCAPVLMIGFNRPDFMRDLLAAVREAKPSRLYVAVDGPRTGREGESSAVEAVRAVAKEVDWPCETKTLFREENLGCARGVAGAIDWFFSNEECGIILEDDIRPSADFFRFATELLERYKDDGRIGLISGFNHYGFQTSHSDSYHFTPYADIWGWASWARVWKDYELDYRPRLPGLENVLRKITSNRRMRSMFRSYASSLADGLYTWDVQFWLEFAEKGYLAVAPRKRLTGNAGMGDARGVHTSGYFFDGTYYSAADAGGTDEPLVHPAEVKKDARAVRLTEARMCGILPRGLTWLGAKFPALGPILTFAGKRLEAVAPFLFRL